jgi:hypothetical protein
MKPFSLAPVMALSLAAACGWAGPSDLSTDDGSAAGGSGGSPGHDARQGTDADETDALREIDAVREIDGRGPAGAPGGRDGAAPEAPGPGPGPDARGDDGGADGQAGVSSQGPAAEGTIVYAQDFEAGLDGITPSPTSIPQSRYQRVDDPLGQRGKVMRIVWEAGDDFRTSPNNKPRSAISNTGYSFPFGAKVSYAWGYMITSVDINATFAQHIRPGGPMWMLEGHNDGDLIVRCGGTTPLSKRLVPNRWYDFRVEVDYSPNGYVQVYIDGEKAYERRDNLGFQAPKNGAAHWDAGIYNTELGISNNKTRTVYVSNLSVGRK